MEPEGKLDYIGRPCPPQTKPKQKIWSQGVMATDLIWKDLVFSEMDLCSPVVHEKLLDSTH